MSTITPYITVHDAAKALAFYKEAFGAEEVMRLAEPSGRIGHAEIKIGDALVMISDEYPDYDAISPVTLNGTSVGLHLMVPNVDAFVERAVKAGGTLKRAVADQFYGQRTGTILDPFGHKWMIATEIEALTNEEIERRAATVMGGQS
jgi:PhnB protein